MSEQDPPQQPKSPDLSPNGPTRVLLTENEINALTQQDFAAHWRQQDSYISMLEQRLSQQEGELVESKLLHDRTRGQLVESQQREKVLVRRLAAKEQETQDYVCQVNEMKSAQVPTPSTLRSTLVDPAVNTLLQLLRTELQMTKSRLEDTQNELSAWKFTPDSNTGKRLMAKCRLLHQENEELGKITSSGRIAKLESDFALQKSFSEEVRKSQAELDSFLSDLDEDVEGMQSTILYLQEELRKAHEATQNLQKENASLKSVANNGRANGDSVCEHERTDLDGDRTRVKRVRRSSVLSIDYEEDTLVINTNGDVAMSDAE